MPSRLEASLAALRLSLAAFFAVWATEKIVAPELAVRIAETFYGVSPDPAFLVATGVGQLVLIAAFAVGIVKTWTTGALLALHTASVLSTLGRLAAPYDPPNHLFWAGVPLVAALLALFLLRDQDRFLTIDTVGRSRVGTHKGDSRRGRDVVHSSIS